MLRIVSSVVAIAAIMAIPFSQADAKNMGGSRGMSRSSMHISSGGPRVSSIRSSSVIGTRKVIIANRRIHHRGRFFVGVGAYGYYDTCWRWVPTAYGLRRVWVCDPYSYY